MYKKTIKTRIRRRAGEKGFGERRNFILKNKAYHRFFEGYKEETVMQEGGKKSRIVREYVDKYYRRDCSDREWFFVKAVYVTLYMAAAALYIFALTSPAESNVAWYAAGPGLLSVIPLTFLLIKITSCLSAKRNMTVYDYKYVFKQVFQYCVVTAAFLGLTALMMLLFIILNPQADFSIEIVPCVCCFFAAGIVIAIGIIERRAKYKRVENPQNSKNISRKK